MQMTIGKKIITSFIALSMLVLLAGTVNIFILNRVAHSTDVIALEKYPVQYSILNAEKTVETFQKTMEQYIHSTDNLTLLEEQLSGQFNDFEMWLGMLRLGTESADFKTRFGDNYNTLELNIVVPPSSGETLAVLSRVAEQGQLINDNRADLVLAHRKYADYIVSVNGHRYPLPSFLNKIQREHIDWYKRLSDSVSIGTPFSGETDPTKGIMGEWLNTWQVNNDVLMKTKGEMTKQHEKLTNLAIKINDESDGKKKARLFRRGLSSVSKIERSFNKMHQLSEEIFAEIEATKKEKMSQIDAAATAINQDLFVVANQAEKEMQQALNNSRRAKNGGKTFMVWLTFFSVIIAAGFGTIMGRSISNTIKHIIAQLSEGSDQVESASAQVASASQSLAEGATEQAAGIEETSSSLEEMTAMIRQTSDNAQLGNTLAKEAHQQASSGSEVMNRMNSSIEDIQHSSSETAKIIKVIDEIAFQTNLLALNAAVEAARAGEAGKGFAVVAEEVRNLAMRSAEAAKTTTNLIENSVNKSDRGVELATEANTILKKIVQNIGKTTDVVTEIAEASNEQSQGIDQINSSVTQMEHVTQSNAAAAEESASAAEELRSQALQMKKIVHALSMMVGGIS